MSRAIITYATGAHEELLDVALPTYKDFAHKHGYDFHVGKKLCELPPSWNKIPLLINALKTYEEVVWFDCDMIIVDPNEDFPPLKNSLHSLVRHFEDNSEVPNGGVWRMQRCCGGLYAEHFLHRIYQLEVFKNHGWWEQAAIMTLMGYTVPPEGSHFPDTKCKCVCHTSWYDACQFMRLCWNSHPNYRAEHPRIVHCSYENMTQRLDTMRALVKDPHYNYPRYNLGRSQDGTEEN